MELVILLVVVAATTVIRAVRIVQQATEVQDVRPRTLKNLKEGEQAPMVKAYLAAPAGVEPHPAADGGAQRRHRGGQQPR